MQHENSNPSQAPYDLLTPDAVLDAMESVGFEPTGGLTALNSYENRVYQVALENGSFVITKFYRPNRWSDSAILEEHRFTQGLFDAELSVVPPIQLDDTSVFQHLGLSLCGFCSTGWPPS